MEMRGFKEQNTIFRGPPDMPDCKDLPVWTGTYAGSEVVVSCWRPSDDEVARILVGEPVYLIIYGKGMPPVSLFAGEKVLQEVINHG